jgi:hypothetical protein
MQMFSLKLVEILAKHNSMCVSKCFEVDKCMVKDLIFF